MTFEEAMVRAKADHVITKTFHQPGNGYREEHTCKCGAFVFSVDWDAHVLAAADRFIAAAGQETET